MLVFKFGGASVKDADGVKNLATIVSLNNSKPLLIVVSAMGKTTNKLEELTRAYFNREGNTEEILSSVKTYHENILNDLFEDKSHPVFDTIANTFVEIEWILEEEPQDDFSFVYDQIVSIAELASTRVISAYLNHQGLNNQWIDARNFIQTDNTYREGKVNWEKTKYIVQQHIPAILSRQIGVTQGFIGGTSENYTTTLGREGSDYSAAIFASCLEAHSVTIWKDVPGVLNADPKLFPDTVKYDELTYIEALEMTYYGATVIHPKTIKPLQNAGIPLFVKPFGAPADSGTVISGSAHSANETSAIIVKNNQILLSISSKDLSFISEDLLSDIFRIFAQHRIKINTMQISAISFTVCFDWDEFSGKKALQQLEEQYILRYNSDLQLITIRHYKEDLIKSLTTGKIILLKQLSRNTAQLVIK
ncbi:MAG TPA: aspartate kinase [Sphingobacteriaceae bacterium]|nr:aspartate kinase [Sphingobacteriaceae bacterium]